MNLYLRVAFSPFSIFHLFSHRNTFFSYFCLHQKDTRIRKLVKNYILPSKRALWHQFASQNIQQPIEWLLDLLHQWQGVLMSKKLNIDRKRKKLKQKRDKIEEKWNKLKNLPRDRLKKNKIDSLWQKFFKNTIKIKIINP